jgi:crossover junction endodeoxyribonuclease RusA
LIEFIVEGSPVSFQARRAQARNEWKARVKAASSSELPKGFRASEGRIAVTLFYFPDAPMQGDLDNIVKLVLDAMCTHIYTDDSQVERILVQKFEPENVFGFTSPSAKLKEALNRQEPALYVRLSDEPFEDLA